MSSWSRIQTWLAANYPDARENLRPPASLAAIQEARSVLGSDLLPDALAAWWAEADGLDWNAGAIPVLPSAYMPLSVGRCIADRAMKLKIEGRESGDPDADGRLLDAGTYDRYFLPEFLPIAADGGGSYLIIDVRQGKLGGCVVEWVIGEGYQTLPLWPSVAVMLDEVAACLEAGEPTMKDRVRRMKQIGHPAWTYRVVRDGGPNLEWERVDSINSISDR